MGQVPDKRELARQTQNVWKDDDVQIFEGSEILLYLQTDLLFVSQFLTYRQRTGDSWARGGKKKTLLFTEIAIASIIYVCSLSPDSQWALRKGPNGYQNANRLTSQERTSEAGTPDLPIMSRVCPLHLGGGYYLYFAGTCHPQYLYLLRLFAIKHLWRDVWKRAYDSSALKMCTNTRNPRRMSSSSQKNTVESRFLCLPANMRIIKCHWC